MQTLADLFAEQARLKRAMEEACKEYEDAYALASFKLATMEQAKAAHKIAENAVVDALPSGQVVLLDDGSAITVHKDVDAIFGPAAKVWSTVKACDVLIPGLGDIGTP